jgi:hypothetical protein
MAGTLPAATLCTVSDHPISPSGGTPPTADDGPLTLRWAVLVLWVEAAALGLLTIFEVYELATGEPTKRGLATVLAAMIAVAAVLAAQFGRLLVRRRAWARGPAIVLQLMALPVSFFMVTGEGGPMVKLAGAGIAAVALVGAGLLLAPASRLALTVR